MDKELSEKIATLKNYSCTEIVSDIGSRDNLDLLLEKVTILDHIYFYDYSVFQTVDELYDMFDLGISGSDGDSKFVCDVYIKETYRYLAHTPEDTARLRKRHQRQRRFNAVIDWFRNPFSVFN
ncbi:MAG: hypothetical protein KZQ89_02875 [Candidatus Thiodiazotropha sp. (ex Lucinoma kastoroae)]|nr:hypothetical protein [Candidatus Thiodiazotropha sp. (ex Lucinoma kastoroae)]